MANGTIVPPLGELKAFHEMVNTMARNVADKTQLPCMRDRVRPHDPAWRAVRVDGLRGALAGRSLWLPKTQKRKRRGGGLRVAAVVATRSYGCRRG